MKLRQAFSKSIKVFAILVVTLQLISCAGGDGGILASTPCGPVPDASAGSVGFGTALDLSWKTPRLRGDGITRLESTEISSYRIYFGVDSGEYLGFLDVPVCETTSASVLGLPPGTYYIVIVTIDTEGRESLYSDEVIKLASV